MDAALPRARYATLWAICFNGDTDGGSVQVNARRELEGGDRSPCLSVFKRLNQAGAEACRYAVNVDVSYCRPNSTPINRPAPKATPTDS